jgi:hypothetical protein
MSKTSSTFPSRNQACSHASTARRRQRSQTPVRTANISATRALSFLVLLYLSSEASSTKSNSFYADAFSNPKCRRAKSSPEAATATTRSSSLHPYSTSSSSSSNGIRPQSRLPSFQFMKDRDSDKKREHYNDALLNRIITGRTSTSSRWRKRTRRAAAALGIQRQHKTEQDYLEEQEQMYQDFLSARPIVPPPTSTIFRSAEGAIKEKESSLYSPISSSIDPTPTKKPKLEIITFSKKRKRKLTEEQHARAKLDWAAKYTSIHTLRQSFGRNRNKFWGDYDAQTTRKLYHTLLPRALLGLYEVGLWSPTDLAPLAFEARVAAKKYARERCILPGRVAAMAYDGFRSWRTWGTWSVEGMSWEQVWNKYETQILEEYMEDHSDVDIDDLQEEITAQICLRILERSCITNEAVDKIFLETSEIKDVKRRRHNAERDLAKIKTKLDRDMTEFLESQRQLEVMNEKKSPFYLDVLGSSMSAPMPNISLSPQNFVWQAINDKEEKDNGKVLDTMDIFLLRMYSQGKRKLNNFFPISRSGQSSTAILDSE